MCGSCGGTKKENGGEECLWKITSKDYRKKVKREAVYKMLVQEVKEIDPLANKTLVVKKINSLRAAYRKELRKTDSLVCGMRAGDVYVPKLWYLDQLLLRTDHEVVPMMAKSSLSAATDVVADNNANDDEDIDVVDETNNVSGLITSPALKNHASQLMDNQSVRSQTPPKRPSSTASTSRLTPLEGLTPNQFKGQKKLEDKVLETVGENLSELKIENTNKEREDQFDIFGRNVAAKLRSLPQEQRIYAEKRINDALFDAELNTFQQNSKTTRQNVAPNHFNNFSTHLSPATSPPSANSNSCKPEFYS